MGILVSTSTVSRKAYTMYWGINGNITQVSQPVAYTTNVAYESAEVPSGTIIEYTAQKVGYEPVRYTVVTTDAAGCV